MPFQNRVDPFGALQATPARGGWMGNRGGRIHRDGGALTARRWASKAWITCRLAFRGRHRPVMGPGYTELFFLDEATAFAAGHRPCFECRRADARAFAEAWGRARAGADEGSAESAPRPRAGEIDAVLHAERLAPSRGARRPGVRLEQAPAGVMIALEGRAWLVGETTIRRWSFEGYDAEEPRFAGSVEALTPLSVMAAFAAGYRPQTAVDPATP